MKVLIALISLASLAAGSLEPANYRPPGSSSTTSSQYLPPDCQTSQNQPQTQHHQQQQQQHHQQDYQRPQSPSTSFQGSSTTPLPRPQQQQQQQQQQNQQYLPPQNQPRPFSLNPKSTSASPSQSQTPQRSSTSSTSAQYLPPRTQQQDQQRRPNNSYLPPNTGVDSRNPVPTPSKEYLPPREQQPNRQSQHQQSQHQQSQHQQSQHQLNQRHEQQSTQVASLPEYLPPNRANSFESSTRGPTDINRIPQGNPTAPRQDYLPPDRSGPSSEYLPPKGSESLPLSYESSDALSNYSPVQNQQQQRQPEYDGLQGSQSGTSLPNSFGNRGYDRPADNYLPPQQSQAPFVPSSSRANSPVSGSGSVGFGADGYRYGGPGGRGSGPGARGTAQAEQSTEAAKYDFEYRVSDEFGNDFAHKEMREGLRTQGSYSVVLPDGRKQIVSYEADESGFRPRISYEAVASVLGAKPALASGVDSYSANGPASSRGYDYNANNVDSRTPY